MKDKEEVFGRCIPFPLTVKLWRNRAEFRFPLSGQHCCLFDCIARLLRLNVPHLSFRFADFISEGQHFTADEIRAYEVDSPFMSVLTDDEEDSDGTGKDES